MKVQNVRSNMPEKNILESEFILRIMAATLKNKNNFYSRFKFKSLTDTGGDTKLVHRRKRPKVDTLFSSLFYRRFRATSMTQRRVENTRVHFWTFSPVSVKTLLFFHSFKASWI